MAVAVSAVVGSSTALPQVRRAMSERELPRPAAAWLLIRIPIGTVASEEAAFRGALGTVAAQAFGPRVGRIVQASAFGLSHVADARGAGESVAGTVLVTGVAGWVFGWLHDRTGSIAAPMLAHLAVNEAGAVAALIVTSQTSRLSASSR
jgi:membrane protease YdiL (CAAX protease family)